MALNGQDGAKIREAIVQFGKNIKTDIARTSPFDKNVNGRIVEITPSGYTVQIQTRNYPNVKAINTQELKVNDIVACCIPNNQMSQVYILGKLVGNISVSASGGTMTDMQVNGVSVVSNGVGNIVTKGTYDANTNKIATESDLDDYVTIDTAQTITGQKTFTQEVIKSQANGYAGYAVNNTGYERGTAPSGNIGLGRFIVNDTDGQYLSYLQTSVDTNGVVQTDLGVRQFSEDKSTNGLAVIREQISRNGDGITMVSRRFLPSADGTLDLGGNDLNGNTRRWRDLRLSRNLYEYGAYAMRGVDAATNYTGYFKIAEGTILGWYRGAKARVYVQDIDSMDWAMLDVVAWVAGNGITSSTKLSVYESTSTSNYRGKFRVVIQQNRATNLQNKIVSLWWHPTGTYQRITAHFIDEVDDSRNSDPVVRKWVKFSRSSAVDQGYVAAGVTDLVNGYVPEANWSESTFQNSTYADVDIYSDISQVEFSGRSLVVTNSDVAYSDTPSTATSRATSFMDKNNVGIGWFNATVGATWNSIGWYLRTKGNVQRNLEFVHYPGSVNLAFDCTANGECDLGQTGRRWRNLYLSGNISDGTNSASVTDVIRSVNLETEVSNPNLLVNADFSVNSTGLTSWTGNDIPCVDEWYFYGGGSTLTSLSSGGLQTTGNGSRIGFWQIVRNKDLLWGKKITISVNINGTVYSHTGTLPATAPTANNTNLTGSAYVNNLRLRVGYYTTINNQMRLLVDYNGTATITTYWIKYELGSNATEFSPSPLPIEEGALRAYNPNTTYPLSSSAASDTKLLSEKAIYDGVVAEINASRKYLHNVGITNERFHVYFSVISEQSTQYPTVSSMFTGAGEALSIFGVSGYYAYTSSGGTSICYPVIQAQRRNTSSGGIFIRYLSSFSSSVVENLTSSDLSTWTFENYYLTPLASAN